MVIALNKFKIKEALMTLPETKLFEELRRASPKVTGALMRMREATYTDGAVPAKYKVLTALAISIVTKCEPCIRAYTRMARDHYSVSFEEFIEFLNVAMTMGGCPGEEWALKALSYWNSSSVAASPDGDGTVCCEPEAREGGNL
jgi:AhpD family alkylhydroperoxidase